MSSKWDPISTGTKLPPIHLNGALTQCRQGAAMDYERWVNQNMDLLKMKTMTADHTLTGIQLPARLAEKIFKVDVDERNGKGETLMISVVLYVVDEIKQAKYLNMLLRLGADPNLGDLKNQRTPIMFACLHKKASAARVLLYDSKINLSLKDRLGNTALMYAALQGEQVIIDMISARLAKSWAFDVFLNKNRTGKTAEAMALWNGKVQCADIMRTSRIRMLQRMHKQLSLIHYSAKLRGWKGYSEAYYAVRLWRSKLKRRRYSVSVPDLIDCTSDQSICTQDGHHQSSIRHGVTLNATRLKAAEVQNLNLKTVKSMVFSFDPFRPGIKSIREFMFVAYGPAARKTNPACRLKVNVKNDRSDPQIEAQLDDGRSLKIYTENLTLYHVANMYNKYVPELVPPTPWYEIYHQQKMVNNLRKKARRRVIKWWQK